MTSLGFNSQPPEGGWLALLALQLQGDVSTHSRPKAAGRFIASPDPEDGSFNSQPPEGGWLRLLHNEIFQNRFQLTAARRRLVVVKATPHEALDVSTHSRPKAAGPLLRSQLVRLGVSTHSRPKAAGSTASPAKPPKDVSTHSRPKAAGCSRARRPPGRDCFNSQPPEGGWPPHTGRVRS